MSLISIVTSIFTLSFGLFCLLTGGFTAYFGTGRSRNIGGALLLLGLVTMFIFVWFIGLLGGVLGEAPLTWSPEEVKVAVVSVFAALAGAVVAIVIFLVAIMKS